MRFLRRLTLNRRAVFDNTLYVDTTNAVVMGSRNNLKLPSGTDAERPAIPDNGMIRFNEDSGDIEVYQGSTWRALRYKESGEIVQQNLGVGDEEQVYFGPLSPSPYAIPSANGYTWTGANLLVLVENVLQLHNTNYTVEDSPTLSAETYSPVVSATATPGNNRLYFNTSTVATGASGTTTTATITFDAMDVAPFAIGSAIIVAGMVPYAYNGNFAVTNCTTTSVSYTLTSPPGGPGALTVFGTVTSTDVVYTAVDIDGAEVSGDPGIPAGAVVTDHYTDPDTGALIYVDLDQNLTLAVSNNTQVTIANPTVTTTGWYLYFSSPVPAGKPVTVLHGFDK
jgi:hypothetical protein